MEGTVSGRICPQCGLEYEGEESLCPHQESEPVEQGNESEADKLLGTIIAEHYEVIALVGEGGMSAVYKARHNLMNRIVAIKMLHKHLVSQTTTIKRFQQEAIAISHLSHPNIVSVHDFGITADVQPYLIMDYLEGASLEDVIRRDGAFSLSRAVKIFYQICDALGHAHAKGIVHRDLKPSNVMLTNVEGNPDFVRIVDFGIAKLTVSAELEGQHLTRTGEIFGSPLYMSPEQCMGQPLDARSDIYSMGCVMYETLTGRPPFKGANMLETMYMRLSENAPSFSSTRPDLKIPAQLEAVVFRAMAPEPKQRYESMAELKDALERTVRQVGTHTGIRAVVPNITARVQQLALKRKRLSPRVLAGIGALLMVASLFFVWREFTRPSVKEPEHFDQEMKWIDLDNDAQRAWDEQDYAGAERQLLAAVKTAETFGQSDSRLLKTLEKLQGLYEEQGAESKRQAVLDRIEEIRSQNPSHELGDAKTALDAVIDSALALVPAHLSRAEWGKYQKLCERLTQWAAMMTDQKNYKRAEDLYKRELDIERQILGTESGDVARTLTNLATLYHKNEGRYDLAEPLYIEAIAIRKKILGERSPDVAETMAGLAQLYQERGRLDESEKLFKSALAIQEESIGANQPDTAETLAGLAELYRVQGRYDEAEPLYKRVLSIDEETPGANEKSVAMSVHNLAGLYANRGMCAEAEPLYRRSLETYQKIHGAEHPFVAKIMNNLAVTQIEQGKFAEAEPLLKRALSIRSRVLSPGHPEIAQSLNSLAEVCRLRGKLDEAQSYLENALNINVKTFGPDHPEVALVLNGFGQLLEARGKLVDAEGFYRRAMDIRRQALGPAHPATAKSMSDLGLLYLKAGRLNEAGPLLKEAMETRQRVLGREHPDTLVSENAYADFLIRTNRLAEGASMKWRTWQSQAMRWWPFKNSPQPSSLQ